MTLTPHGYYELKSKPKPEELKAYYAEKYYQQSIRVHRHTYDEDELSHRRNKLAQKLLKVTALSPSLARSGCTFLDIGAGEGFALGYFHEKGWDVCGLDYSRFGCETHHSHLLERLIVGDVNESLVHLAKQARHFDLVLMDNLLEHVLDPLALLRQVTQLLSPTSVLIVEVPNDFSVLQLKLVEQGKIPGPVWVTVPDHISYFNHSGLQALARDAGLQQLAVQADYPIDFALFNEHTNYVRDKTTGRSCHLSRLAVENLMHSISPAAANSYYEALAAMGLGRQIVAFFSKTSA